MERWDTSDAAYGSPYFFSKLGLFKVTELPVNLSNSYKETLSYASLRKKDNKLIALLVLLGKNQAIDFLLATFLELWNSPPYRPKEKLWYTAMFTYVIL